MHSDGAQSVTSSKRRSCCTKMWLSWVVPVVVKGYSTPLQEADAPNLPSVMNSRSLTLKAQNLWAMEVQRSQALNMGNSNKEAKPKLWSVVYGLASQQINIGVVTSVSQGLLNTVGKPLVLKVVIGLITQEGDLNIWYVTIAAW